MINFFRRIFEKHRIERTKHHLKQLLLLANVDGDYHVKEDQLLKAIANESNITNKRLTEIIRNISSVRIVEETDVDRKFRQLYQFIEMMMADGKVKPEEVLLCQHFALGLNFDSGVVMELVEAIASCITYKHDVEETRRRVSRLVSFSSPK